MKNSGKAARRYARALFLYGQEQGSLDALAGDLSGLGRLLRDCPDLAAFVKNPVIPEVKRDAVLDTLLAKADATTVRAMRYLVHRRRLALLPGICAAFQQMYDELRGVLRVDIVSASELQAGQVDAICGKLQKRLGKTIAAAVRVDASLLGGFLVIAGDQVYDHSIRSQLERLKKRILNA